MIIRILTRSVFIFLVTLTGVMQCEAQDSLKKTEVKPVVKKPLAIPYKAPVPKPGRPATVGAVTAKPPAQHPVYAVADTTGMSNMQPAQQYQYVLSKIYRYQQPLVAALWKNVSDSLSVNTKKLAATQAKLTAANKAIDSLKADSGKNVAAAASAGSKSDSITALGMSFSKTTYNIVAGTLIIGLALALLIVIITTAKYRHEAKYRVTLYDELDEEYKTYKAKANEKEKKLARELQTERNKLDELLGR